MNRSLQHGMILGLVFALLAGPVSLHGGTKVSAAALESAVRAFLAERQGALQVQPDITFRSVPAEIAIAESTYTLHVAADGRTSWKGPIGLRVEIESRGQIVHRCMVSVLIRTYADVLVAERPIGRHMAPAADDVRALRMETTMLQRPMLENGADLAAMRTRQIVTRGSILYADLFEQVPLVLQGDHVRVRVQTGGVTLSAEGTAREDGNRGEYITVDIDGRRDRVRARVDGVRSVCVPLAAGKENQ